MFLAVMYLMGRTGFVLHRVLRLSFITDKLTIEQNWGYQEAAYDLNVNQGCLLYRLFLRTLPNHFKPNSIYAHYPMTVPEGRLLSAVCDETDLTNV